MKKISFLIPALSLIILAAGCSSTQQTIDITPESQTTPPAESIAVSPDASTPSITPPIIPEITIVTSTSETQPTPIAPISSVSVDNTWKTYTNSSLNFSFQWPIKGRYAPMWNVKFMKEIDPLIQGGCYKNSNYPDSSSQETLDVKGISFCHIQQQGGVAGTTRLFDSFVTKKDKTYIVISITKEMYSAGALNCPFVAQTPFSSNPKACVSFFQDEYKATLNALINTFKFEK